MVNVNQVASEIKDWLESQGLRCVLHASPIPTGTATVECTGDITRHGFAFLSVNVEEDGLMLEIEDLLLPPSEVIKKASEIHRDIGEKAYTYGTRIMTKIHLDAYNLKTDHMDIVGQVLSILKPRG